MRSFRNQNLKVTWFTNLRKLRGRNYFSFQTYRIELKYDATVFMLSFFLKPITVDNYASFFICKPTGLASDSMMAPTTIFILVGWGRTFLPVAWSIGVQLVFFFSSRFSVRLFGFPGIYNCRAAYCICESSFLIHHSVYYNLFFRP